MHFDIQWLKADVLGRVTLKRIIARKGLDTVLYCIRRCYNAYLCLGLAHVFSRFWHFKNPTENEKSWALSDSVAAGQSPDAVPSTKILVVQVPTT